MAKAGRGKNRPHILSGPELGFRSSELIVAFANAASAPPRCRPPSMASYADLVAWGRRQGLRLSPGTPPPADADDVLRDALKLRDVAVRLGHALARRNDAIREEVAAINRYLCGPAGLAVVPGTGGFEWSWSGTDPGRQILWLVAWSGAHLLASGDHRGVRQCEAAGCPQLLLDLLPRRRRLYCDSKICGNREKARRQREMW